MITPVFDLSQDDDFVKLLIKTPYVKAGSDFSFDIDFPCTCSMIIIFGHFATRETLLDVSVTFNSRRNSLGSEMTALEFDLLFPNLWLHSFPFVSFFFFSFLMLNFTLMAVNLNFT